MFDNLLEKLKAVNSDIKKKNFSPYYFIYGEEPYFINSIISNIKKEFIDNTGMNFIAFNNENFDVDKAISTITNFPMMNEKKCIVFRNVDFFKSKIEKKENVEAFIDALEKAKDINIILIAMDEYEYKYQEKYTKGNKIVDFINKNGILIDSKKLQEDDLVKYVVSFFKKNSYEIDKLNALYFIQTAGKNLVSLHSESKKIVDYLCNPQKITKEIIDKCVSRNIEDNVFALIDLINNHKQEEAYKLYGDLISEGIMPFTLFSLFTSNFESLLLIKDLTEQTKSMKDICDITKFPDWKVRKLQNVIKGMTKESILKKLQKITKLNNDYMKGEINQNLMIELLFT